MSKPTETRIGCYAVLIEGETLLVCRLSPGLQHVGKWTLPGGGLEFGEHPIKGVAREVMEETGLVVQPGSLLQMNSKLWEFPEKDMHSIQMLFSATILGGDLRDEIDGSTDRVEWVQMSTLNESNSVDIVLDAVEIAKQL